MDVDKMPMESVNALGVLISHLFSDFWASRKEKGLFSAWDSFAQDAICNKNIKAQKKPPRSPVKASGLSPIESESVTSDVQGCWLALNIALD